MNTRTPVFESVSPRQAPASSVLKELKLMFAALGAGGRVVPLGDNSRTLRLLSEYAACLHRD
jgi:hypothetical protein